MGKKSFNKGDEVEWTSTANGSTLAKKGIVIGLIPANVAPSDLYPELKGVTSTQDKLGYGKHGASTCDRVLVRVERVSKAGGSLMPWYYAPRLSALKALGSQL